MVKAVAVVPAAGYGSRMKTEIKKQYLSLDGVPVLGHVLKVMDAAPVIQSIVIITGPGEEEYCRLAIVDKLGINKVTAIVPGGKERQDSVYNGLLALSPDTGIVLVHDGARPLLRPEGLEEVVTAAVKYGAATLAVPVKDTVKLAGEDGFVSRTLPRERLWLTQTPQAFRYDIILSAHHKAREGGFTGTDDAGLVEHLGLPVKIVPGAYENIKITTPEDLIVASALIKADKEMAGESVSP